MLVTVTAVTIGDAALAVPQPLVDVTVAVYVSAAVRAGTVTDQAPLLLALVVQLLTGAFVLFNVILALDADVPLIVVAPANNTPLASVVITGG